MPTYTYLLEDKSSIAFNYAEAEQGVVVLTKEDGEYEVIASADIHYTLCQKRFFKPEDPDDNVNLKVMPKIYLCNINGKTIPLHVLEQSVLARYNVDFSRFNKIFKSDTEIKSDKEINLMQLKVENEKREAKKKKDKNLVNAFYKKQEELSQKEFKKFCKNNGIAVPKNKENRRNGKGIKLKYIM